MAKIVFHSAAYYGDVMPYVPIANELARRGHDVTYALPTGFHELLGGERFAVADSGNPFCPAFVANDPEHDFMVSKRGMTLAGALTGRYYAKEFVVPYLRSGVDALTAAADGADLFVTHPMAGVATRIASDHLGISMVTGHLFPIMLPTSERPPPGLPATVGAVHDALWSLTLLGARAAMFDSAINGYRDELGLAPIRAAVIRSALHEGMLVLASPTYTPPPADWDPTWSTTGFTLWDGPAGQSLDPAIDAYLDGGDPPVVVSLGTSAASVARKVFEAVAVRLDDRGIRGLFLVGSLDNVAPWMRDHPGVFAFAPLTAVLPRCRALVQSGSHGTNAAALTAGIPVVTVPFLFDQVWNGKRMEALRLGRLVPTRRRTERLWDALDDVLTDDGYGRRAAAYALSLADEDGVTVATDLIEQRI
jgi:rhamnosyltransferase subunit B